MNIWGTLKTWAQGAWYAITHPGGPGGGPGVGLFQGIIHLAQLVDWFMRNPFTAVTSVLGLLADIFTGNMQAANNAAARISSWIWGNQIRPVRDDLQRLLRNLRQWVTGQLDALWGFAGYVFQQSEMYARRLFAAEAAARVRGDKQSQAYTRQQVALVHQVIEREAASGYAQTRHGRISAIEQLLTDLAGRDPVVRALTKRLATLAADLLGAESLPERLLAGALIGQLVKRAGIEAPLAAFTQALLGPLLGDPKPHDLHGVIADITARLGALEDQQAQFYRDGGSQLLQAGSSWRDWTGLGIDAALLAFAAAAAADPAATAREVSAVIRPIGTDTIASAARLIGKG